MSFIPEKEEIRYVVPDYAYLFSGFESEMLDSLLSQFVEVGLLEVDGKNKAVLKDRDVLEELASRLDPQVSMKIKWLIGAISGLDEEKLVELTDRVLGVCESLDTSMIFGKKVNELLRELERLEKKLSTQLPIAEPPGA